MDAQKTKPQYEKPKVMDYGDLRELTAVQSTGPLTDVPKGQPAAFMS